MVYQLLKLIVFGLCGFVVLAQTPFMDSNCQSYVQRGMVTGSYEKGRGIDRSYNWELIKKNYNDKASELESLISESGSLNQVAEKTKLCQGEGNPPNNCSSFQAHCLRELKNRGLGDLFQAWSLRLDECLNNPNIIYKGQTIKYKEAYGENCEPEKVIRNVKGVQYIKKDFDKFDEQLPDDVRALWEELNQKYAQWENSLDLLAQGRESGIKDENEKDEFIAAKAQTDKILDECKHHFDISLAGHQPTPCLTDKSSPFGEKNEFKDFIKEIDDLSKSQSLVINVADQDIEKAVLARLYIARITGEANHDKESLSKALCRVKGERKQFDFCSSQFSKQRNQLVEKAMNQLPRDLPQIDIDNEVKNINTSLSDIKPLCRNIKKAESTISMSWMASDPKDSAHNKAFVRKMRSDGYKDKKELSRKVREVYVDKLMANSMIPGMMGTDALKRLRLSETIDNCDIKPVNKKDVLKAIYQSKSVALESINESIEHINEPRAKANYNRLKDILRTNPAGVYQAIVDNKNPDLASFVCNTLRKQKNWDKAYSIGKGVLVGALVASAFIPGVGAATIPLATALTTIELAEAGNQILEGRQDRRAYIQQGVANQFVDFEGLKSTEEKIDGAITNAAIEIALEWGTVGVGKALKTTSNLISTRKVRKNSQLAINKADYKKLTTSGKNNIQNFFQQNKLSEEFSKKLNKFSNDPVSIEYIRLFTGKMSPQEVERFFQELSRFKNVEDFKAFAKNISADQIKSSDDFFIAMAKFKSNGKELELIAAKTDQQLLEFKNTNKAEDDVVTIDYNKLSDSSKLDVQERIKIKKEIKKSVENIKAGDQVKLSDGKVFNIKKVISSEGGKNQVFELDDGSILRMYKSSEKERQMFGPNAYLAGSEKLANEGLNIPKVLEVDPNGMWIRVEKVDIDDSVGTFNDYMKKRGELSPDVVKQVDESFLNFSEATAKYEKLDDFHTEQIVYGKDGKWHYLDPGRVNIKSSDDYGSSVFRNNSDYRENYGGHKLLVEAEKRIALKRAKPNTLTRLQPTSKEFTEMSVRDARFIDDIPETYLKELNTAVYDDFYTGYYKSAKDTPYIDTFKKMHSRYQSYKGITSGAAKEIRPGVIRDGQSAVPIHMLGKANFKKASQSVRESLGKMKPGENVFNVPASASSQIKSRYKNLEDLNQYYTPAGLKMNKADYFKNKIKGTDNDALVEYMNKNYDLQGIEAEQLANISKTKSYDEVANEAFRLAHKHESSNILSEIVNNGNKPVGDLLNDYNIKTVDVEMTPGIPKSDKTKIINFTTSSSAPRYRLMVFPKGQNLKSYEKVLNNKMSNLKNNGSKMSDDEFLDEVAEFYHTGINGHMFEKGNNSLMMTQINVMLKDRGMRHISHGRLDFNAFSQNLDDFKGTFKETILEAQK